MNKIAYLGLNTSTTTSNHDVHVIFILVRASFGILIIRMCLNKDAFAQEIEIQNHLQLFDRLDMNKLLG